MINNCFANGSTNFFREQVLGLVYSTVTFGAKIFFAKLLYGAKSAHFHCDILVFLFDQQNLIRNLMRNACEVLTICLKIITRATIVFALTCRTLFI